METYVWKKGGQGIGKGGEELTMPAGCASSGLGAALRLSNFAL